jgi:NitT/TauT family transport system permease protein
MAAEIFTVGQRNFQLPGLGTYLHEAANQGDVRAIGWGLATLVLIIVALDQLVWRPLLTWSERFKVEMVESENPPTSWFYELVHGTWLNDWLSAKVWTPMVEAWDRSLVEHFPARTSWEMKERGRSWIGTLLAVVVAAALAFGAYRAGLMLAALSGAQWGSIGIGVGATLLRVSIALAIALAWTVPVGVVIGTNARLARWLQPVVQIVASVPATALFPIFVLLLVGLPAGLNLAAILLMLMGTQWYLLFNVIAGASAIPQDLKYTSTLLQLDRWQRWRTLILPALFPYIVTGAITASGGAWNASIVAEYTQFAGRTLHTVGIGALIAQATASGNYSLLLAATLGLIVAVVTVNRLVWRRLYNLAEDRYRME